MDAPISFAILLTLGLSIFETLQSGAHAYFDSVVMLIFFLLAGRYLDFRARAVARSAAQELAALEVPRAIRVVDGVERTVNVAELAVGDLVLVRPGGRMPVDGVVVSGQSELDRALLTGETLPVFAGEGSFVSAGEVNLTGPLTVRVTAAGKDSSLHRMADLVAKCRIRAHQIYHAGRTRGAGLCPQHSNSVAGRVLCLDVSDRRRSARGDQCGGDNAYHHLPLCAGFGRAPRL